MAPHRPLCPICRRPLDRIRLSTSGTAYGCSSCDRPAESDPGIAEQAPDARVSTPRGEVALERAGVVLNLRVSSLGEAIRALVPKALHGAGRAILKSEALAEELCQRVSARGAELRPGLAFVSSTMPLLAGRRVALGISPGGLRLETPPYDRIFVVALFLNPQKDDGAPPPRWAQRQFSKSQTIFKLRTAKSVDAVLKLLI